MIFKKGDKVFGGPNVKWGEVLDNKDDDEYPLKVMFKCRTEHYTCEGKLFESDESPTLSFTEYTLEGFSQVRPKEPLPFKEGYVVYLSDKGAKCWNTSFLRKVGNSHFINDNGVSYSQLALENPLINEETKIYTKDDL
jgi:hypothetical protein